MSKKSCSDIPQEYLEYIGTKQTVSGCVFSYAKEIEPEEFTVLGVRRGTAKVIDYEKLKVTNLTYELKLKNESMSRAQWTKPFPDLITDTTGVEI